MNESSEKEPRPIDMVASLQMMTTAIVFHMWVMQRGLPDKVAKPVVMILMFSSIVYYFHRPLGNALDDVVGLVRNRFSEN